ncbi:hypothetical protein AHF37_04329 [Paragonimus kellicotti]|nr:hypothetical protein AHF37_04329 [Paragonimus kellicotti]
MFKAICEIKVSTAHGYLSSPQRRNQLVALYIRSSVLMPKGSTVSHRRRFERDFGPAPGEASQAKRKGSKPKDYQDWFSCNTSDHFRIGISFAKKSVKLYSAFADSDLILASPLGLQTIIDEEKEKEADLQYITASTELLIIDQAEMLLMQNWSNVQKIVSLLNQRPTKAAFASAARIRLAYLAGYGRRYRQTLIFSAVAASLITLLTGDCENFQGLNFIPPWPHFNSIYSSYLPDSVRVPGAKRLQTHQDSLPDAVKRPRPGADIPTLTADVKLNLITFAVSGQALSEVQMGNESDSQSSEDESDVGRSTEPIVSPGISYSEDSEAERFRTLFALGRIRIMLLSERYYFFRRRKIRGAQTFIFYGPPTFPWFVRELIEFSHNEDNQNTSTPIQLTMIYYPPYEAHQVSTITGKVDL